MSIFSSILFTDGFFTQARDIITEGKGQILDQIWHNDTRVEKTDHGTFGLLDTTLVGKSSAHKKLVSKSLLSLDVYWLRGFKISLIYSS